MMTPVQQSVLDGYFTDLNDANDCYQLYSREDAIRDVMKFLMDTQAIGYNEYEAYDDRLRREVWNVEQAKGF